MPSNVRVACLAAACIALAGCGTAVAAPHAQPTTASCSARMRLTDPYLDPVQVTALCAGVPLPAVTKTVTVKVSEPAPTVTVTANSGYTLPCYVDPGAAYPVLQPAGTGPWQELTCSVSVTDVPPQSSAEEDLTISAPGYGSETYLVTVP